MLMYISGTNLKTTYVVPVEDIAITSNSVYVNLRKTETNFKQIWDSR